MKSRQQTLCEKQFSNGFDITNKGGGFDENDEDLQFHESDVNNVQSLNEPDSKLSLDWKFSQQSSERTPSGDRNQNYSRKENNQRNNNNNEGQKRPGSKLIKLLLPLNNSQTKVKDFDSNYQQNDQKVLYSYRSQKNNYFQDLDYIQIRGSQNYQTLLQNPIDYNVLENKQIFTDRLIGISHQIQPRRARHLPKREGFDKILKKNFTLRPEEEVKLLDRMLIFQKQRALSKVERRVLKIIVKRGFPEQYRKQLWLRASGASATISMPEYKEYYSKLKRLDMKYPNPSFNQIELDLRRTFYELKMSQSEQLINKLRNVLTTYCKRNPTIGYCQGMNFLVGRLLKVTIQKQRETQSLKSQINQRLSSAQTCNVYQSEIVPNPIQNSLIKSENSTRYFNQTSQRYQEDEIDDQDEEEAFWIFTHLVESILPIDYFSNMVGALIDQKIFYDIFKERIPDLCSHLESVGFDPSLLAFQWLVCLLSYNLPQEVSMKIWDLFFLKGTKVIFRMSLALLYLMKYEIMRTSDFGEIFEILEAFPRRFIDDKTLIQTAEMRKFKIKNWQIKKMRLEKRTKVEEELQRLVQIKDNFKGTYTRLKFLNKFYLYNGVQKSDNLNSTTNELFYKSLDQYENEVMRVFNCSPEWPICLFDFTYKNKIPSYIVFRTSSEPPKLIENYMYPEMVRINQEAQNLSFLQCEQEQDDIEFGLSLDKNGDGLLIERGEHYCECFQKFQHNFKRMYEKGDLRLFNNQNLGFDIVNDLNSHRSLIQFMREIAQSDINLDVYLFENFLDSKSNQSNMGLRIKNSFRSNISNMPHSFKEQSNDQTLVGSQDQQEKIKQKRKLKEEYINAEELDHEVILKKALENQFEVKRFKTAAYKRSILEEVQDKIDNEQNNEYYDQQLEISQNSLLHQSAYDMIVGDTDQKKAKKYGHIFNKKLFSKYF